ncbi:hypothetical protein GJ744_007481 [Endocarpon pusillum]|uniref:Uncharacterized protein n=1 Tax=Endocarpon pusillum TaxID=364733 RepID=A0A8H7E7I9_9EURO|nr:hypothetical protein GJ744_007481 [Endocarpon pusillum]
MSDQQRSTKRKNQKLLHITPTQNLKKPHQIPKPPPRTPPHTILTGLDSKKRKRTTENRNPEHSNKRECIIIKDEDAAPPVPAPKTPTKEKKASWSTKIWIDLDLDPVLGSTPGTAIDLCQSDEEPKRKNRVKETKQKVRCQAWLEEVPDESCSIRCNNNYVTCEQVLG